MGVRAETVARVGSRFDRGNWLALGVVALMAIASATTAVLPLARPGDGCALDVFAMNVTEWCVGD